MFQAFHFYHRCENKISKKPGRFVRRTRYADIGTVEGKNIFVALAWIE